MSNHLFKRVIRWRLKQQRLKLGLSQENVAENVGVSVRRYQEIESGSITLNPRLDTLIKYCQVLGLKLEDLLRQPLREEVEASQKKDPRRVPKKVKRKS